MVYRYINYYKLAVEKDRDSIFTTVTTIWKPDFSLNWCIRINQYFIYTLSLIVNAVLSLFVNYHTWIQGVT